MKRVLLTGLSGTGKSSVILALAARGYQAVDLDSDDYSHWVEVSAKTDDGLSVEPGREWIWRSKGCGAWDWYQRPARWSGGKSAPHCAWIVI